ncbi:VCBS repeat-containing protein, partial [bacterium]|nr:VCBS repeat-containing protein [bacterium]
MLKQVMNITILFMIVFCYSSLVFAGDFLLGSSWESGEVKDTVMSFDFDDVNNNYDHDIVYCSYDKIVVSEFGDNKLKVLAQKKAGMKTQFHRVTIGDWDEDGTKEILINGFIRSRAYSWLYRIENNQFVLEQEFEALVMPLTFQKKEQLYSQQMSGKWQWASAIQKMGLQQGKWAKLDEVIKVNHGIGGHAPSLYAATTYNDFIVSLRDDNKLIMRDKQGKKTWLSSMNYGGSADYIDMSDTDALGLVKQKRFLIPPRMRVQQDELMVVKNNSYLNDFVGNVPNVKSSQIVTLAKMRIGFQEKKITSRLPGVITDIKIVDLNMDVIDEAMVSFLIKKAGYLDAYAGYTSVLAV